MRFAEERNILRTPLGYSPGFNCLIYIVTDMVVKELRAVQGFLTYSNVTKTDNVRLGHLQTGFKGHSKQSRELYKVLTKEMADGTVYERQVRRRASKSSKDKSGTPQSRSRSISNSNSAPGAAGRKSRKKKKLERSHSSRSSAKVRKNQLRSNTAQRPEEAEARAKDLMEAEELIRVESTDSVLNANAPLPVIDGTTSVITSMTSGANGTSTSLEVITQVTTVTTVTTITRTEKQVLSGGVQGAPPAYEEGTAPRGGVANKK